MSIEQVVFHVANALRVPVLILALLALAVVLIELGALVVELARRRRRDTARLERAAVAARTALSGDDSDSGAAARELHGAATTSALSRAYSQLVAMAAAPGAEPRMAKRLADFDLRSLQRLERTRLLVRAGPALGLMGTLIPLSPALAGLARGDVTRLTDNLRVAFSVTVLGLLIGAVAFGISLVRDRLYAQDLSDLEFVAALLEERPA